jgi:hypothetical protein
MCPTINVALRNSGGGGSGGYEGLGIHFWVEGEENGKGRGK